MRMLKSNCCVCHSFTCVENLLEHRPSSVLKMFIPKALFLSKVTQCCIEKTTNYRTVDREESIEVMNYLTLNGL